MRGIRRWSFDSRVAGIFEPESGALMARRAVAAVVAEATRQGVEYLHEAAITPRGSGRWRQWVVRAAARSTQASFVFACGPWLPKVFPELLVGTIEVTRQEAYFFGTPPGDSALRGRRQCRYGSTSAIRAVHTVSPIWKTAGVKIALDQHGPPIDPDTADRVPSADTLAAAREIPRPANAGAAGRSVGGSARLPVREHLNGDFLIDRHPDFDNVWLVGGGSGHGFKHGPAVGEYVAARVFNGGAVDPRFALASKAEHHHRTVF